MVSDVGARWIAGGDLRGNVQALNALTARRGELERYLVDAPTRPMRLGSTLLGFALVVIGLVLLAGVAIGFFSGG